MCAAVDATNQTLGGNPNKWNCDYCTFENEGAKRVCDMCCKTRLDVVTPMTNPNALAVTGSPIKQQKSPLRQGEASEEWKQAPVSHPELSLPSNEGALFRAVVSNHRRSLDTLQIRRTELEQIGSVWRQGDVFGALKTVEHAPLDVQADFLTFAAQQFCCKSKRNELLTLGAAAIIAPVCAQLLMSDSPKQGIATLCVRYCHAILHAFDTRLQAAVQKGLMHMQAAGITRSNSDPFMANQREVECTNILTAFQKIAHVLQQGGQPGGRGAQVAAAATKSNGAEVAEVLARMQSVFAA